MIKECQIFEKAHKYCEDQNLKYDLTACEVLSIIEKMKGTDEFRKRKNA